MASVPFDQLEGEIWFNGEFVPWKDAKIHVLTHGLHYASAVFEGERAYGGEIFKLTEHTERLHTSGEILGFKIPYSVAEIDQACVELLARQGFEDAYVRPIAWRGSEMMGVSAQKNRINLAIAIWQWPSYFKPEERMKGIRLDIAEYRRPDPRTAPSRSITTTGAGSSSERPEAPPRSSSRMRMRGSLRRCSSSRRQRTTSQPTRPGLRRERSSHS